MSQLRLSTGVSARDMSLSLGLSEGYVNKLENEKTLPSMHTFFTICEYFHITPYDFFNFEEESPIEIRLAIRELKQLRMDQLERLVGIMHDINQGNR
ncbi:MAG: helix-turn-helix domain-containing protein [Clostridium sp.]|nr:helix-turn-helix domain-containing protein [Clostridium sp.]